LPSSHMLLNHPQREHFAVMLAQMEDALDEVVLLARADVATGGLTTYDDDVPTVFAGRIEPVIIRLRGRIASMAAAFRIPSRRVSRGRSISALATAALIHIEDSHARNLRGYGATAPELASVLDPLLDELRDDWTAIKAAVDWT
jgi:hypothetical protein